MQHEWVRLGAEVCHLKDDGDPPGTPYRVEVWVLWKCTCGFKLYALPDCPQSRLGSCEGSAQSSVC
jgi:hypothetical protein